MKALFDNVLLYNVAIVITRHEQYFQARVKLEQMEELYTNYDARMDGLQKVFVETKFSDPPCAGSPELLTF